MHSVGNPIECHQHHRQLGNHIARCRQFEIHRPHIKSPPAGFTVRTWLPIKLTPLYKNDCFGITMLALARLGKSTLDSFSGPLKFQSNSYPDVILLLDGGQSSTRAGPFNIKYMIWGLILAMKQMTDREEFRNWRFELNWQGIVVGSAWFVDNRFLDSTQLTSLNATTSPVSSSHSIPDAVPSVLQRHPLRTNANVDIWIKDEPQELGSNLNLNTIMMIIFLGLKDIAGHALDANTDNYNFSVSLQLYPARLFLEANPMHESRQPPPSWFTFELVRRTLLRVGERYLNTEGTHGVYNPVDIIFAMQGKFVRAGYLRPS